MTRFLSPRWRPLQAGVIVLAIIAVAANFGPTKRLAQKFLASLRVPKVQAVSVDLSSFVGPNANPTLQQMVSQMISDHVNVTVNEQEQSVADAGAASQLAGFPIKLLTARKDAPKLAVGGRHELTLAVDRARLQAIVAEAGRPDLSLPPAIDGAAVSVKLPRTVRAQYGTCPGPPSATANVITPTPASTEFNDCVVLTEGPSPVVNVPAALNVEQLVQIGLELAGMSPNQAHEFLQTVNWQSTLGVSVPRFMRSYESVTVDGVPGTLLNTAGRRGPTYALVWANKSMVYSMTGFGDSGRAVALADSLK
jgi:hypothetical protein